MERVETSPRSRAHARLWRAAAWSILAVALLSVAFCQSSTITSTPPKPLRERLLERSLKGDAEAQFELAKNYETGRIGLPKDLSQAQHWYREAASQGEPFAAVSLGILFNFGKGVKRDDVQAFIWYQRALSHLSGGDRETIIEMRDRVAANLSSGQLAEARRTAEEWQTKPKN